MTESASEGPDSTVMRTSDEPSDGAEASRTRWHDSPEGYLILAGIAVFGLAVLAVGITHALGRDFQPHDTHRVEILRTAGAFALATPLIGFAGAGFYLNWASYRARRRVALAELRSSTFSQRANIATVALHEATLLVEELRAELEARMALLADVKRQVESTEERAREIKNLAQVDEETTRTLNRYFDEALARRLGELERGAKRREWLLGTVGALAFGITAILVAHYLFGF